MNALLDLFSPLPKEWCGLFQILTIFAFFVFVFAVIGAIDFIMFKNKKLSLWMISGVLIALVLPFINYISIRLLYSMCVSSL